ncbi:hypothetical protein VPH35_032299 [Triticum aestivum]
MDDAVRWDLPTDVLVEILPRLPPSSRRRVRLVCRLWRHIIDEHTAEMQSRATTLIWHPWRAVACVVDDLSSSSTGSCRELWRSVRGVQLVGTCNGLLCLCNNEEKPGGIITLVNPATGERLHLPPLPSAEKFIGSFHWMNWHETYNFAYQPMSGRYKIVQLCVPCSLDHVCEFNGVRVLTLGETSRREVATLPEGGARCNLGAGIVSIDDATHWITRGSTTRVVSFDLKDERITSTTELPTRAAGPCRYHLMEVHGRLGIVIHDLSVTIEVWIMEEGRRWSRRYSFRRQNLPRPHFVYGEYVLTREESSLYGHYRKKGPSLSGEVVQVGHRDQGTLVAEIKGDYSHSQYRTFAYVETTEPLSVYEANIY